MTGWDVQVSGVKGVVNNTLHAARPLDGHAKALGSEMQSAAEAAGIDVVQQALNTFAEHAEVVLPNIGKELTAVLNGAVQATHAYIEGDERMAVGAERAAARATGWLPPTQRRSPLNDGRRP